ncbi:MAG: hypothetical protein WD751_04185 [Anaerolineales bacterium]
MDSVESLPEMTGDLKDDDRVLTIPPTVKGLRFPIYVNAQHGAFIEPCLVQLKLERPSLSTPLHYCVSYRHDQVKIEGEATGHGITVIAGWDVTKMDTGEPTSYLMIRGE